jgi:cytochrome c-type biogenesis protein CcmH/NrfF
MAKRIREQLAEMVDRGLTDQQILEQLGEEHGPKLLRPHMLP